jgi:uncharacterized protein YndB with AHSA1/START domain
MCHHASYTFSAPAEAVFNTMTDPHLAIRWFPPGMTLRRRADGTVAVGWTRDGPRRQAEYRITVSPAELCVRWSPADGRPGWHGQALLHDLPAGGSVLDLELRPPGPDPARASVADRVVADALRRLDGAVAENFTPG